MSFDYASRYPGLRFDRPADGVLLITIDGHGDLNAYDEAMHEGFGRVWLDVADDPHTRVVVITGAGDAFQVGSVIKLERTYESVVRGMREASAVVYNLINCEKPVISAINGPANDGGLALALLATSASSPRTPGSVTGISRSGLRPATILRSCGHCYAAWHGPSTTC